MVFASSRFHPCLGIILVILCQRIAGQCGYDACTETNDDMINVHLVPHTHDDTGWLKTVDQYYYGTRNDIQIAGVQYILDSVIPALEANPERKFIYVEIAFFWRWWNQQTDDMKKRVKTLVNTGRLEFTNGGWCMNDEAVTHYNAIIDQMTLGLKFLKSTFGECGTPRAAWHIDPFGHSREQASLFAQMGFDGFYFARIDYADKNMRLNDKRMEVLWLGRDFEKDLTPPETLIFTGVTFNNYSPPDWFCYDLLCRGDPPIQDDRNLYDYNVDERVDAALKYAINQSHYYRTNHIMWTMGEDFNYQDSHTWFKNLDKLIKYVNARQANGSMVNFLYSTPACYTKAIHDTGLQWHVDTSDFLPYASWDHAYWTGFYTSRPGFKGLVRKANNILQACKQLDVYRRMKTFNHKAAPTDLIHAMALAQHHDAVTGTARQHVNDDYTKRLAIGIDKCHEVMSEGMLASSLIKPTPEMSVKFCSYLNISACALTEESDNFTVVVYNPMFRILKNYPVRIPMNLTDVDVYCIDDGANSTILHQFVPVPPSTYAVRRDKGSATHELVFIVELSPLTTHAFFVSKSDSNAIQRRSRTHNSTYPRSNMFSTISNGEISLNFNVEGVLGSMCEMNYCVKMTNLMYWYNASSTSSSSYQGNSGAYIFRPNSTNPHPINNRASVKVYKGPVVEELHQELSPWASQVVRVYNSGVFAEFEWTVGPIPISDDLGKEIISRFDTNIASNMTFYTDSNGRQIMKRIRNHRQNWDLNVTEPASGNYYPVNSRIFITNKTEFNENTDYISSDQTLAILTDRSQGGSSLSDGSVELMVHRRLLVDDGFGVGEALNETGQYGDGLIVRGKHYVALLDDTNIDLQVHKAEEINMAPIVGFIPGGDIQRFLSSWKPHKKSNQKSFSSLAIDANIHLLTMEVWDDDSILLRVENQYQPATVDLDVIMQFFAIIPLSYREVSLGANMDIDEVNRLVWKKESTSYQQQFNKQNTTTQSMIIELKHLEIRSFIIRVFWAHV